MKSGQPIPWDADMHTKAKHAVYEKYLSKWTPIMLRGFGANITYAEGFSGPGVYKDGGPGSPVLALLSVLRDSECRRLAAQGRMRFVFVDHDQRCVDRLRSELGLATTPVPLEGSTATGLTWWWHAATVSQILRSTLPKWEPGAVRCLSFLTLGGVVFRTI